MVFGLGGPIISAGAPKVVAQLFTGAQRGLAMGIYMTGPAVGGVVSLTLTHSLLLPAFDGSWRRVMALWPLVSCGGALFWLLVATLNRVDKQQQAATEPYVPQLQIMRELAAAPAVRVVLMMSVGVFLFNHSLNNWLPELLRSGGMTTLEAGYWAALPTVIGIAGSLLIPRLATPSRRFHILIVLCLLAATASILLQSADPVPLSAGLLLQGIARSSLTTVLVLSLVELPGIGDRRAGAASGMFFSAAEIGGVLGPISLGLIYDFSGHFHLALASLTVVAVLLALGSASLQKLSTNAA